MKARISSLLLCSDAQSLCSVDRIFTEYEVDTDVCLTTPAALNAVKQRKFDMLVLDFDLPGLDELLDYRPMDTMGYPSIVIALTHSPEAVKQALTKRVHFVLQKPFSSDLMGKTLKAAYSLIVKEKRSAFRHSVRIDASASIVDGGMKRPLGNAHLLDISYTGICLKADQGIPKDVTVFIDFQLPETHDHIHSIGKVMWTDPHGQAGIQFRFIAPDEFKQLRNWLISKCPWDNELLPRSAPHPQLTAEASSMH